MVCNEGIPVEIEWRNMTLGSSFFIPALDTEPLIEQILIEAKQHRIKLVHKETIENGKVGIRCWRIK
jgi:hypothetical protein